MMHRGHAPCLESGLQLRMPCIMQWDPIPECAVNIVIQIVRYLQLAVNTTRCGFVSVCWPQKQRKSNGDGCRWSNARLHPASCSASSNGSNFRPEKYCSRDRQLSQIERSRLRIFDTFSEQTPTQLPLSTEWTTILYLKKIMKFLDKFFRAQWVDYIVSHQFGSWTSAPRWTGNSYHYEQSSVAEPVLSHKLDQGLRVSEKTWAGSKTINFSRYWNISSCHCAHILYDEDHACAVLHAARS